jgi:hypothetical protein
LIEFLLYRPPATEGLAIPFVTQSFFPGSLMIRCPNKYLADYPFYQMAEIKTGRMRLAFGAFTTRLTTKLGPFQ